MEVVITKENFENLKNGDKPLVVDFWATWCGPCRMISPIISKLAEKYDGKYRRRTPSRRGGEQKGTGVYPGANPV